MEKEKQHNHKLKKYRQSIINVIITGLLILGQFVWISALLYWASSEFKYVNAVVQGLAIIISLYVASRDIRSVQKLSWAFLMLALPIIGVPTYFIFGRPQLTYGRRKKMNAVLADSKAYKPEDPEVVEELKGQSLDAYLQSRYIANYGGYPLQREGETSYYDCGEAFFPALLEDLKTAEHFIFIEFFIIGEGRMFKPILEILEQKVAEGVEVRIIYDDFGSAQVIPPHYERTLEAKGIKTIRFNPFRPFMSIIMNNRDHRKIVVIDNRISYTGGVNLSDEYINIAPRFGYWKDDAVRMTGGACANFTVMFLEMWNYAKRKEHIDYAPYLQCGDVTCPTGDGFVQPYADSPLDHEYVGEVVYMNMINRAHDYVYIASPYLIIGAEMTAALINAAKSGVDVRIAVPSIPDKKTVYQVTKSNFRQLINGGVKIYTYTPGFIHTKCMVADDEYAVIGSINLDYRSLTLHFECASFHYKTAAVMKAKEDMVGVYEVSKLVTAEECESKNVIKRTTLMIIKLFSPLM